MRYLTEIIFPRQKVYYFPLLSAAPGAFNSDGREMSVFWSAEFSPTLSLGITLLESFANNRTTLSP